MKKSLKQSSLLSDLKMASVAPIHKSGQPYAVNNYHPISLTSVCTKIVEHILYTAIVNHIVILYSTLTSMYLDRGYHASRK